MEKIYSLKIKFPRLLLIIIACFIALFSNAQGYIATSTYLGGNGSEQIPFMQVIGNEVHIVGRTPSTNYPVTNGSTFGGGGSDIVYTKLNASTGAIITSTYLGGSGSDASDAMQVIGNEVHILGTTTSTNYPVTNGSTNGGGSDIVYTKLNASTGAIITSTYLGGSGSDVPNAMQVIGNEVHIVGRTLSTNYPVTNGSTFGGGVQDIVYTKLNASTGAIITSTYLGGSGTDASNAMQVIGNEVHIVGRTSNTNYPVTNGSTYGGGLQDIVYTKLNAGTGAIITSTYLGGSGVEQFTPVMQVIGNEVHIAGSADFNYPVTNGSTNSGAVDFVYTKLNAGTGAIITSTFLGGSSNDQNPVMQVIGNEVHIIGNGTDNYPVTNGSTFGTGTFDIVYTKLNASTGAICFSTYLGGIGLDERRAMQVTGNEVHVLGLTASTNYPVTNGNTFGGSTRDIVYTKLSLCPSFTVSGDLISPASQTKCKFSIGSQLTGIDVLPQAGPFPLLDRAGSSSTQNVGNLFDYQWQVSNSAGGPWTDIPLANTQNYLPTVTGIDQYYRRQVRQNPCCGGAVISTSAVAAVLVDANMAPSISMLGAYNTCPGSGVGIGGPSIASGGVAPYTYLWDNAPSLSSATVPNPTATVAVQTIFTVTVTDANGCQQIGQTVVKPYSADAGADKSFCAGTSGVQIGTAALAGVPGVGYSWSPATNLSSATVAQPIASPASSTTYTLTLTIPITGGGTCPTTDAVLVTSVAAPVTPNFAGPDRVICFGSTATLGTAAEAGFVYTWSPGNYLTTSTASTTTFTPGVLALPTPDPITYYLTAAKSGCSFYDSVRAAVIKADAGIDVCGPALIGTPDQTPDINETYSWVKISGPGNFLGATNLPQVPVSASVGGSTTYQLTVSYTLGGVSGSCTDQVVVTDCSALPGGGCPAVNITINAPNSCPSYALNGGNVSLTASSAIEGTFAWTTTGGVTLSANTGPTVFLTNNNSGTVTVTVTSIYDPTFSCSESRPVNNPAWALPVFTAQDPVICPGASTPIGQFNVAGYSYLWTNTSPSTLNSTTNSNPTATPTDLVTNYPVIVTDVGSGCTTRDTATVTIVSSPANAGPDYTICANGIVTLGAPALPNTTYSWSPAASPWQNSTNEFSAQPQVLVASNLTFTLTTTNTITGCTSTDAVTITVSASPTIPNAPDVTICKGGSGIVIGSPAQAGVSYSWSPTTGLSNPNIAQPTANPTSTTTYTCTATFTGCSATSDAVTVTVNDPSFTLVPQSYCPSSGALTLSGPGGYTNYSWSPASQVVSPSSQNTLTLNPPPSSAFTYTLTATRTVNSVGCVGSAPLVVTPTVPGPVAGTNRNICLGSSTTLGSSSNSTGTYSWSPAAGLNNATSPQPVFTPTATGTTTFTVTKTESGCVSTATVSVLVTGFTLPALTSPTVCQNASVQIGTTPVNGITYAWAPSTNLSNPNIPNPVATVGTGNMTYSLNAEDLNGCQATATVLINVNPVPAPQISVPAVTACLAEASANFAPVVTPAGAYTFLWSPSAFLSNPNIQNPSVLLTGAGTKTYTVTVTGANGCANIATATLNVNYCSALASLGNFVWSDNNNNGVQDAGEPGIAGVTVTLFNSSGVAIATTQTAADGYFFFANQNAGNYIVGFTLPANYSFTSSNYTSGFDATNSDVNPSTGRTTSITLVDGEIQPNIDAGLVPLSVLPVRLIFTAIKQDTKAVLTWKVSAESDVLNYTLEHSGDGRNFVAIYTANSNGRNSYTKEDAEPLSGMNYYRVKVTNLSGSIEYSEIKLLLFGSKGIINIFPNPASKRVNIQLPNNWQGKQVSIILLNQLGQEVLNQSKDRASQIETINIGHLASGIYNLRLVNQDGEVEVRQVVKD